MFDPIQIKITPHLSPHCLGAVFLSLVLITVSSACSVDVGEETKRFACEDSRDCVEGFVCLPVDNAERKECVIEGSGTTTDAARPDTATTDATTDATKSDTTTADATESDTTITDTGVGDVEDDVWCSPTADTETSCKDGSGDEDCDGRVDCNDSDCYWDKWCAHTIAVSPTATTGDGLSGQMADSICQSLNPQLNDHPTGWKAIISTSANDARDRVAISGRVINRDGVHIATNADDFWDSSLNAPVAYNQLVDPENALVWTFSSKDGLRAYGCETPGGTVGTSQAEDEAWINHSRIDCSTSHPVYCINRQY